MGKVTIRKERCKGCGLCVQACPKGNLALGKKYNAKGYAYVTGGHGECVGCGFCAELCPDMVFNVYREEAKKHA